MSCRFHALTLRAATARVAVLVLAMVLLAPLSSLAHAPSSARQATSVPVGPSTLSFGPDWAQAPYDTPNTVHLVHQQLPTTSYLFSDTVDPEVLNLSFVFYEFSAGFIKQFGDGDDRIVADGGLSPDNAWWLYALSRDGVPFGVLMMAEGTAEEVGRVKMSVLIAPADTFELAARAAVDTIDRDGAGSPLTGIVPAELAAALTDVAPGGQAQPTLPAGSGGGSEIVVAGVTVSYGQAWVYDDANSVPAERIYLDSADPSLPRFYGLQVEANPGFDAITLRDSFAETYLDITGVTGVQTAAVGETSAGTAWSIYFAEQSGSPAAIIVYADVASVAGQVQIHMIFTSPDDLRAALLEAQSSIRTNGIAAFRDLNPATLPGSGSAASQPTAESGVMLPDAFLGIWSGAGTETDPPATWPLTVTFRGGGVGQVVGTATYPTLACGSDLVLQSIDPASGGIVVVEAITTGAANCTDGGSMTFLAMDGAEQVTFTWRGPEGTGTGEGTLEPIRASSRTVGISTVAFSLDWEEDTANPDPASLVLSHALLSDTLFTYTEYPVADPDLALANVERGLFNGFGDGDQVIVAGGSLPSGAGWRLYTVSRAGVPYAVLLAADIATQPGQVLVSILLAPAGTIGLATQIVQDTVGIVDRGSPLAGVVPAELEAALSAT